jgi:hypothetical protein
MSDTMEKFSTRVLNEELFNQLTSGNRDLEKNAQESVELFTRKKLREDGFWRKILPPISVQNSDLQRPVDTDKNEMVFDMEPYSPGAVSMPYASLPLNRYIRQERYRVLFDRISTPRFTKDVSELRTTRMDIRQVLSDNSIKDMLAEEDGKGIRSVNTILVGANQVIAETGIAQWRTLAMPLDRVGWTEARKIMPSTTCHLNVKTVLLNNITVLEFEKWGRDMIGGDLAEEIVKNGYALRTFGGVNLIVTIKRDLVPDGALFMFAEPKFLGKFMVLEDATMAIKKEFFLIEFFSYEEIGGAIANVAAIARADFSQVFGSATPHLA